MEGPIAIRNVVWFKCMEGNQTLPELLVLQKTVEMVMIRLIWGGGGTGAPWPPPGHTTASSSGPLDSPSFLMLHVQH